MCSDLLLDDFQCQVPDHPEFEEAGGHNGGHQPPGQRGHGQPIIL